MNIKDSLKLALADRGFIIALIGVGAATLLILLLGVFQIRPSELQVPVRYSSFGITNFYRDRWYYLLGFVAFALIIAVLHVLVSLRLYVSKGRELAVGFLWLSVIILLISSVFIYAILRVVSLSQ